MSVQAAIPLSLTLKHRRRRTVRVRDQSHAKRFCAKKLNLKDTTEKCAKWGANVTGVQHDHSYFCNREQTTPVENMVGELEGKSSVATQTDLTVDEIDYLVSKVEEYRRENKILSEKLENKKDLKRELNTEDMLRDDESVKFYTGLPNLACFNFTLGLIQPYTKNIKYWYKKKDSKSYYQTDVFKNKPGRRRQLTEKEEYL